MSIKIRVILGLFVASVSISSYAGEWSVGIIAGQTSFDEIDDVACFGGGFANANGGFSGTPMLRINKINRLTMGVTH